MTNSLQMAQCLGQSIWYDNIRRGLTCRIYQMEGGLTGWPTVDMIRERLRILRAREAAIYTGDAA